MSETRSEGEGEIIPAPEADIQISEPIIGEPEETPPPVAKKNPIRRIASKIVDTGKSVVQGTRTQFEQHAGMMNKERIISDNIDADWIARSFFHVDLSGKIFPQDKDIDGVLVDLGYYDGQEEVVKARPKVIEALNALKKVGLLEQPGKDEGRIWRIRKNEEAEDVFAHLAETSRKRNGEIPPDSPIMQRIEESR